MVQNSKTQFKLIRSIVVVLVELSIQRVTYIIAISYAATSANAMEQWILSQINIYIVNLLI